MINQFEMQLTQKYVSQYRKSSKKERGQILFDYCQLTKVKRNTAVRRLLRKRLTPIIYPIKRKGKRRGPKTKYLIVHKNLLYKCWILSGKICAERLVVMIPDYLIQLKKSGKINPYSLDDIKIVRNISESTVKRIIKTFPENILSSLYPKKRKGNLSLYKQIPIKANFGSKVTQSGFVEVDYVEHNGGNAGGRFAITGNYTDVFNGWCVRATGFGKSLSSVTNIHEILMTRIYHKILEYHPDNAPTILSLLFYRLKEVETKKEKTFRLSRSRPYHKNDNAHVEQKNGDKIRLLVGYHRYETQPQIDLLNSIYEKADYYDNFFIPSSRLIKKLLDKNGKVIKKEYDKPKTPYKRIIEDKTVDRKVKTILKIIYDKLDMVELRREIDFLITKLKKTTG